jgi:hypothetical protein
MQRISVALPDPFGPSQPRQRPRGTSNVTSVTALVEPKRLETRSSAMIVSGANERRQLSFARLRSLS